MNTGQAYNIGAIRHLLLQRSRPTNHDVSACTLPRFALLLVR